MSSKQAITVILFLALLISGCFVPFAASQETETPETISVTLNTPETNTTKTDNLNVTFTYTPVLLTAGDEKFYGANLVLNGSIMGAATNQTAIANNTANTITYKFTENGTYQWNIRIQNRTNVMTAPEPFNLTVTVYVPDPTPTPTPTPSPSPTPVPTAVPTATPTPTPILTPTPTPPPDTGLSTWAIVIIIVFVVSGVLAAALFFAKRRAR